MIYAYCTVCRGSHEILDGKGKGQWCYGCGEYTAVTVTITNEVDVRIHMWSSAWENMA
jgi:uncharacterized Zn finger protein